MRRRPVAGAPVNQQRALTQVQRGVDAFLQRSLPGGARPDVSTIALAPTLSQPGATFEKVVRRPRWQASAGDDDVFWRRRRQHVQAFKTFRSARRAPGNTKRYCCLVVSSKTVSPAASPTLGIARLRTPSGPSIGAAIVRLRRPPDKKGNVATEPRDHARHVDPRRGMLTRFTAAQLGERRWLADR